MLFHIMLQLSCILYATSAEMSTGMAALTVGCDSGEGPGLPVPCAAPGPGGPCGAPLARWSGHVLPNRRRNKRPHSGAPSQKTSQSNAVYYRPHPRPGGSSEGGAWLPCSWGARLGFHRGQEKARVAGVHNEGEGVKMGGEKDKGAKHLLQTPGQRAPPAQPQQGPLQPIRNRGRSRFEDFDFLAKYCIFSQEKLAEYKRAFEAILEMVDFRVTDGLTDLRLFAVIASLAQKIATMDCSCSCWRCRQGVLWPSRAVSAQSSSWWS
uniref:uncharacterized protein LOC124013671 isoform X2 n=1 Tax=Oncorhynchus gorbuscha TaxID=8017 RepID=UPI001EAF8447|nr:uncharacterized protein LOC124013671 isoform X2 [Oncorhynchus gorbuscha]